MKKRLFRLCTFCVCLLLLFAPLTLSHADITFCPAFFSLAERYRGGETLALTLSGQISKLLPFESSELAIINGALDGASLTMRAAADGSGAFELTRSGEPVLSFAYREDLLSVNGDILLLGPVAQEQLISQDVSDHYACMTAIVASLPQLETAVSLFVPAKAVSGTAITCLGNMREGRAYTVTAENLTLFVERAASLLPAVSGMESVCDALALCEGSGDSVLTFYSDSQGNTVCCEGTGSLLIGGVEHSFHLIVGMTAGGIHFSVTVSALEGKGLYKFILKARVSDGDSNQKNLSGSLEYMQRTDESKYSVDGEVSLSARSRADGDTLSGRVTWTETKDGNERTYTLRPDLTITADEVSGTLSISQKKGETVLFSTDTQLQLVFTQPVLADVQRPDHVDAYSTEKVEDMLLSIFAGQMASLEKQDMYLLTHALRSDVWMEFTTDLQKVYSIFDFQVEE